MRTAIDTKSLSASWSAEPLTSEAARLLGRAHREGGLVIRRAVYCELLAYPKITGSFVDGFLAETQIVVDFDLDDAIWREAVQTFAGYAERGRQSGVVRRAGFRVTFS